MNPHATPPVRLALRLLGALLATTMHTHGQTPERQPHIGYVYPAGGQRGTVVQVLVGGQNIGEATAVHVSGEGVQATVVHVFRPSRQIDPDQRNELERRLTELRTKRLSGLGGKLTAASLMLPGERPPAPPGAKPAKPPPGATAPATPPGPVTLPDHPLLWELDAKGLRELQHVAWELFNPDRQRRRQTSTPNPETVLVEITLARDAALGDRDLRLRGPRGLTNPLCFRVDDLREVRELEPNDPGTVDRLPAESPLKPPVLLNGQVMPGDIDRFAFQARPGERLVVHVQARHLVPFLADTVPGWFQATVALIGTDGREIAFADDYRFDPDPVLVYEFEEGGVYGLEIRDALYRGREDFVYRIALGDLPLVTSVFPAGGRVGTRVIAALDGVHLPVKRLRLDTQPGNEAVRAASVTGSGPAASPVAYAVDALPEVTEAEPNDTPERAQRLTPPVVVNARIGEAGDTDTYRVRGRKGQTLVAEVQARGLDSPLDSLLRLSDHAGQVLAWNDDSLRKVGDLYPDLGLRTQQADSYLSARLPADGEYSVQVSDAQGHGGDACVYRLRVSPPRPDFVLRQTPSGVAIAAGRCAPLTVHVQRRDGFAGPIDLALVDPPAGFGLQGAQIPAGRDSVRVTLSAPPRPPDHPVSLGLVGRAMVDGAVVTRPVEPADEVMQAFLYRHLVPARERLVAVTPAKWPPAAWSWVTDKPIRIALGGTAEVMLQSEGRRGSPPVELELRDPPPGLSLRTVRPSARGLTLELAADAKLVKAGFADNLIVEAFTLTTTPPPGKGKGEAKDKPEGKPKDKGKGAQAGAAAVAPEEPPAKRRVSLGLLPAVAVEVVGQP